MASRAEALTARFYKWEAYGRGQLTFDQPVELEPYFYPFYGHYVSPPQTVTDDSRKKGIIGRVIDLFKQPAPAEEEQEEEFDVTGITYADTEELFAFSVVFPKDCDVDVSAMQQLLIALAYTEYPISFEIQGNARTINLHFVCREPDYDTVYSQVQAFFPMATIGEVDSDAIQEASEKAVCFLDLCLSNEFMLPLRTLSKSDPDPFIGLLGAMETLHGKEQLTIQVLFQGAVQPWADSIIRSVTDNEGKPFFINAPDIPKLAKEKVQSQLFAVSVRVLGAADSVDRAQQIARSLRKTLTSTTRSQNNSLTPISSDDRTVEDYYIDMLGRITHRSGMLLNVSELITLVHFPSSDVTSSKLQREIRKTKEAPADASSKDCVIGVNVHRGIKKEVSVPAHMRLRHTHVIGATGTGKSTLLLSMIGQDMKNGNGVAVLDPHGDLIETILAHVPDNRINDVIVIDPSDSEYPVGFNILSAHSETEKEILSSDLVAAFRRLSTSWGDQMNSVFANAILAFLESSEGGTLADLRRFLIEKPYRESYLKTVSDPNIVYYWQHEYPLLKSSSIGSILTRLDGFLRPKLIRNMVAQRKSIDFEEILDSKKILLVKLSQGLIGTENSFLLGTFFVTKMYQAATARQAKAQSDRSEYYLYIDEFQNYITPSISHLLSGARKYKLGLILAHQDMQQLQKYDSELANSVVTNACTRICFRLGDTDAKRFAGGFAHFDVNNLENLKTGEAIARIEQPNHDFNLSTLPLAEVGEDIATAKRNTVICLSREKYGMPRVVVEEMLNQIPIFAKEEPKKPKEVIIETPIAYKEETVPLLTVEEKKPVEMRTGTIRKQTEQKTETRHRYLQTLIKRIAQSKGYKAAIEEVTPDGKGKVDVSLEKNGKRIGCEVSITTTNVWETHNVEKCLAAGYDYVVVCSDNLKHLQNIREALTKKIIPDDLDKIAVLNPDEIIQFLTIKGGDDPKQVKVIKGYKVKVEYNDIGSEEMNSTQQNVARVLISSKVKKT